MEQPNLESKDGHAEAVSLVERHRDFFEHYACGKIEIKPAPEGLATFAFDLEKNIIYVNSMFYEKLGFSEQKTIFATLHEIEHFMEKIRILSWDEGAKAFVEFLDKIKNSKAFALMDNCVADIRENRAISQKINGMKELETIIYKEDLFPKRDFTSSPRHIQFCQALLFEARVSGELCEVSEDVRATLNDVAAVKNLMDAMTDPDTPMFKRLKLQDKYIWPKVQALLEKDIKDKKENHKKGGGEKGEESTEDRDGEKGKDGEQGNKGDNKVDPNKFFADEYAEIEKKFPEAVPLKEIEKALKKWQEAQYSPDKADEDYAKKNGVEKKDLQDYRKIVQDLNILINPETNVGILEELRNLFYRIIAERFKIAQAPKYPVEEGDELVDPAQLVADVKSGNIKPKVWEDTEIKEKKGERFGEVEITIVGDRSSSMVEGDGQKAIAQRKAIVAMMEVLKEFAEICENERANVDKFLEVKSEIYSFADSVEDKTPLKKMTAELGEAERINIFKKFQDLPGGTTDFDCLEAIFNNLDDGTKRKIKTGELKKIVIVLSDGKSDDPAKVKTQLKNLRDVGVIVIGLGMTKSGEAVLTTYAPQASVVEDISRLTVILAELLKEHLKDI